MGSSGAVIRKGDRLFCPQCGQRGGQERVLGYICVADVPATASIMLTRGQEILTGDWYACYESIKKGNPCK
jgi:hypothetical protein